ncbi:MAG TPA: urease subunit beta [Candidatus Nesterenkonia stercoripullorum]|uniref:Urease subunit beta n=1 Tax=Candidatus Nesterenkonia stercoripullorum TaxID=2838701 RepID=A0A9D1S2T6_9MICC|nr:urease subunit beta [Candidatus Nesterenkonia stercoripullorum]
MNETSAKGPGAIRVRPGTIELNARATAEQRIRLVFHNTGDRPIQIGSHIHLPDVNPALEFDRARAQGYRLDVPAGASQRFEPGVSRELDIVALGGRGVVPGVRLPEHLREGEA